MAAHAPVVGEGAGRLAVEGVAVAGLPHWSAGTGSWTRTREEFRIQTSVSSKKVQQHFNEHLKKISMRIKDESECLAKCVNQVFKCLFDIYLKHLILFVETFGAEAGSVKTIKGNKVELFIVCFCF